VSEKPQPPPAVGLISELSRFVGEQRLTSAAGAVAKGMAQTKAAVDGNIDSVLALANLPSRSELVAVQRKLDSIERTLINMNRKLDRLSASLEPDD